MASLPTTNDEEKEVLQRYKRRQVAFKSRICWDIGSEGGCAYGDSCRFAHSPEELRPLTREEKGVPHSVRDLPEISGRLCKDFERNGECKYGSRCFYIHSGRQKKTCSLDQLKRRIERLLRSNEWDDDKGSYVETALDSDSDEDQDSARPSKFDRKERRKADYSKAVSFVSAGGLEQCSNGVNEGKAEDAEVKLARPSSTAPEPKPQQQAADGKALAGAISAAPTSTKFADWTKHGKGGVLMNMMKKWGYKHGAGLGRQGQGIVEPIQVTKRPGRGAVGAYGKEAPGPKFGESARDAQRRAKQERGGALPDEDLWPAMGSKKNAQVNVANRTKAAKHSGLEVMDMTGPEQRVLTSHEALSMNSVREDAADGHMQCDVPESSMIDLTEEDTMKMFHQPASHLEKELELMAVRQRLIFTKQQGRTIDGSQVYLFGSQSVFVEDDVVCVMDASSTPEGWRPISVHELMDIACEYRTL